MNVKLADVARRGVEGTLSEDRGKA